MSSTATVVQPVERQDVHKSCRTIETLLTVLTDYCEAASAFAAIRKKLSRALKDAASLKTNAHFAGQSFLSLAQPSHSHNLVLISQCFRCECRHPRRLGRHRHQVCKDSRQGIQGRQLRGQKVVQETGGQSSPALVNPPKSPSRKRKRHTTSA